MVKQQHLFRSGILKIFVLLMISLPVLGSDMRSDKIPGNITAVNFRNRCVKSTTYTAKPDASVKQTGTSDEFEDFPVDIPDPNLDYLFRRSLMKPYGPIMRSDLAGLESLHYMYESGIVNFDGIQYCTGLTELLFYWEFGENTDLSNICQLAQLETLEFLHWDFSDNDLTQLANLQNLKSLSFKYCTGMADISPMANLPNLESISLIEQGEMEIDFTGGFESLKTLHFNPSDTASLTGFSSLQELENLIIGGREISGLDGIGELANLKTLFLSTGPEFDLSVLASCTKLTALNLGYYSCEIDLSPLSSLTGLESLTVHWSGTKDISFLASLENLKELYLSSSEISDISFLENLPNLEILNLSGNPITDLAPLSGLTNLKELHLGSVQITDPEPLANLVNLEKLYLQNCGIEDIGFLGNLVNLIELTLDSCAEPWQCRFEPGEDRSDRFGKITDITPLSGCVNLTSLSIMDQSVADLTPLSNLRALERLNLRKNYISDLSPIAGHLSLTRLYLDINEISDITPLVDLANITYLDLSNNDITDLQPFLEENYPGRNLFLRFYGNPIPEETLGELHNHLMSLGIIIRFTNDYRYGGDIQIPDLGLEMAFGYMYDGCCLEMVTMGDLRCLKTFSAPGFRIFSLEMLENCVSLEELDLSNNYIYDISQLENLPNLATINLSNNLISDLSPLVNNPGVGEGDILNLESNILSHEAIHVQIPELVARGVSVIY